MQNLEDLLFGTIISSLPQAAEAGVTLRNTELSSKRSNFCKYTPTCSMMTPCCVRLSVWSQIQLHATGPGEAHIHDHFLKKFSTPCYLPQMLQCCEMVLNGKPKYRRRCYLPKPVGLDILSMSHVDLMEGASAIFSWFLPTYIVPPNHGVSHSPRPQPFMEDF